MKEATGEVSMTVIVIVAVAVIGGILAALWPRITTFINNSWGGNANNYCPTGQTWNEKTGKCQ